MPGAKDKIVYAFNSFYADFISYAASLDPDLKKRLKKNYRVVDRTSDTHVIEFNKSALQAEAYSLSYPSGIDLDALSEGGLRVAAALPLSDVLASCEMSRVKARFHVSVLLALSMVFRDLCEADSSGGEDGGAESGLCDLVEALANVVSESRGAGGKSGAEAAACTIADSEFRAAATEIAGAGAELTVAERLESEEEGSPPEGGRPLSALANLAGMGLDPSKLAGLDPSKLAGLDPSKIEELVDGLKDSTLGKIAQEVSESINAESIQEALKNTEGGVEGIMQAFLSGKGGAGMNGMLGDLIKDVGEKISSHIKSGNITEEQIMKETMDTVSVMQKIMS